MTSPEGGLQKNQSVTAITCSRFYITKLEIYRCIEFNFHEFQI
jgi:hypothetical protein